MDYNEIQSTLASMLAVQKELQDSQLRFSESMSVIRDDISDLKDIAQSHERRLSQLVGYSITGESELLDLRQEINNLKRRVLRLEGQRET